MVHTVTIFSPKCFKQIEYPLPDVVATLVIPGLGGEGKGIGNSKTAWISWDYLETIQEHQQKNKAQENKQNSHDYQWGGMDQ